MGFFNSLFSKTGRIEDEFFGTLLFSRPSKKHEGYFDGKRFFKPSGKIIEFTLDASVNGPTQAQKQFFGKIEDEYVSITKQAKPLIINEFRNWMPGFVIANFNDEFTPVSLEIPRLDREPVKWEISFETIHDEEHIITITFSGFTPTNISIDG